MRTLLPNESGDTTPLFLSLTVATVLLLCFASGNHRGPIKRISNLAHRVGVSAMSFLPRRAE